MNCVLDNDAVSHLIRANLQHVIQSLFDNVYLPEAVRQELLKGNKPELAPLHQWANAPPSWVTIRDQETIDQTLSSRLGQGEKAAISLAKEVGAEWVITDDKRAIRAAEERGLKTAGTLDLVEEAYRRNQLQYDRSVDKLVVEGNFYARAEALDESKARLETQERKLAPEKVLIDKGMPVEPFKEQFKGYEVVTREELGISERASAKDVVELAALQNVKVIISRDSEIENAADRSSHRVATLTLAGAEAGKEDVLRKAMPDIRKVVEERRIEIPPPAPSVGMGRGF